MECETEAVRTALSRLKRASARVLEERFEVKLVVVFTRVNICLKRKDAGGGFGFVYKFHRRSTNKE